MSFTPPFCPRRGCPCNLHPTPGFYRPHGYYRSSLHPRPLRRFRCRSCRLTFGLMTFRYAYRQKKPHVDAPLLRLLCNGVSLRAAARLLAINPKTVSHKLRRLGRHAQRQQRAVLQQHPLRGHFQLDEMETFETSRFQPLTVPLLIDKHSYFIAALATAPLRRSGRMTPRQKARRNAFETLHGRRPSRSDQAVRRCLATLCRHADGPVPLDSDRKPSYHRIARRLLGPRLLHATFDSKTRRNRANPLFPINHTNAMARYGLARLRRRTWCVSKRRRWLELALHAWAGWFNFCRGVTIHTNVTPAEALGLASRRLQLNEWLRWRHDGHLQGRLLPQPLISHS